MEVSECNPADPFFWDLPRTRRNQLFDDLLTLGPVHRRPTPDLPGLVAGESYWAVLGHSECVAVSRNPSIFSNEPQGSTLVDPPPEAAAFASLLDMDDPRHARLRGIVSRRFTARFLDSLMDSVERRANEAVESLRHSDRCDFISEYAAPFPLNVICDMMGIPADQRSAVHHHSDILSGNLDPEILEGLSSQEAVLASIQELATLMLELAAKRRERPTDDLLSALLDATIDGDALTDVELGSFFVFLLGAGYETTRNAMAHGLVALTEHPDQRAVWQADFDRIAPHAVEEIVRYATPVNYMRRTVTSDTTLADKTLSAGDKVLIVYTAANRDPQIFRHPDQFDVCRNPNPHIGFGGPGPHFCLGAHLARREITLGYRELFRQIPDIRAVGEPEFLHSAFLNGIKNARVSHHTGLILLSAVGNMRLSDICQQVGDCL